MHQTSDIRGATLVELLVGLTISGILLTAMLALMSQQTTHLNKLSENYAFLSNLRFAVYWINSDIQKIGFLGCTPINSSKLDNQSLKLTPLKFVHYEEEDNKGRLGLVTGTYLPDITISTTPTAYSNFITLNATTETDWTPGQILAITDCQKASLFAVSTFDKAQSKVFHETFQKRDNKKSLTKKINHTSQLKWRFNADKQNLQLIQIEPVTYSIKHKKKGSGLYRNDVEIMPDILSFQLRFQIDTNCDGTTDTNSNRPPTDLTKLGAIEVHLTHKQKFLNDKGTFRQTFPLTNRCLLR